jgi:ribosomal protein S18 acetylase RimI-like enzyme
VTDSAPAQVRAAGAADLPALRRLFALTLDREPVQRAALADLLFHRDADALVAVADEHMVGCVFASRAATRGHIDGFAVHPAWRRQGIGSRLLATATERLRAAGARTVTIGDNTATAYAWPGIDLAYPAANALAQRSGFARTGTAQNMTVDLADWVPDRRRAGDLELRRATGADRDGLDAFIAARFDPAWRREAARALDRSPATVFVVTAADRIAGFACHGVYRVDWFGPIGVDPRYRHARVGQALLAGCLDDLAAAGLAAAQISWIGPADFYRRTVGARCERVFALYTHRTGAGSVDSTRRRVASGAPSSSQSR